MANRPQEIPRPATQFELCVAETAYELACDVATIYLDLRPVALYGQTVLKLPQFDRLPPLPANRQPWHGMAETTAEYVAERYYATMTPDAFDALVAHVIDTYNKRYAGTPAMNYC